MLGKREIMLLKWGSIGGYLLLALSLLGLLANRSLVSSGVSGIVVQVIGVILMIWARVSFGWRSFHFAANPTKGGLVTKGPYRYIRHPIYTAVMLFIIPGLLTHLTVLNGILGLLSMVGVGIRVMAEEQLVVKEYPEYSDYSKHTKRFIPYLLLF